MRRRDYWHKKDFLIDISRGAKLQSLKEGYLDRNLIDQGWKNYIFKKNLQRQTAIKKLERNMDNNLLAKVLLIIGVLFILGSILIQRGIKLPFGRLPGDIIIKKDSFTFYFPLTTGIIISIILTVIFTFLRKR